MIITKKQVMLPKRKRTSHKGQNGNVLVIGGSYDFVGAVVLAGLAALRSGVDWVTIMCPEKVGWAIHCLTPNLVTRKVKTEFFSARHIPLALKEEQKYDVVLIGNGISLKSKAFCRGFLRRSLKPLVIDADAVKAVRIQDVDNAILTPHHKEFELLLKNSKLTERNFQKYLKYNIVIVKGAVDTIYTRGKIFKNKTGNPGMTKGGTGDVLAGLAVGFLAQSGDLLQSAINATFFNGLIGDILFKKHKGYSYLASDMVDEIKAMRSRNFSPR
ncbi:MAG: NAD(P)H-hydrate dehydratase [Candidatus Buchananbacteria bacterium CG10_big_fil_rev_8_21_14_0_10_42_9]|uniref:ADP-dependent (S)-NAD(P)H-hydrate dehydratase n=1 Tax=Candidatus Buchananbacteria bacterium CG10_big_fil_rev_8_21_14_0_10_42_9 TaxID=1974526 RepID=A0A2H0W2I9_9BACT|nr:MAG: NAD(P)H-hydrate dehydratase [Candidatus Buchananbacteria bacterium CG10_big_fil_rev_8_21_14_0_10_42_9]